MLCPDSTQIIFPNPSAVLQGPSPDTIRWQKQEERLQDAHALISSFLARLTAVEKVAEEAKAEAAACRRTIDDQAEILEGRGIWRPEGFSAHC